MYDNEYRTNEICPRCGKGHLYDMFRVAKVCEFSDEVSKEPKLDDGNGSKKYCDYKLISG